MDIAVWPFMPYISICKHFSQVLRLASQGLYSSVPTNQQAAVNLITTDTQIFDQVWHEMCLVNGFKICFFLCMLIYF